MSSLASFFDHLREDNPSQNIPDPADYELMAHQLRQQEAFGSSWPYYLPGFVGPMLFLLPALSMPVWMDAAFFLALALVALYFPGGWKIQSGWKGITDASGVLARIFAWILWLQQADQWPLWWTVSAMLALEVLLLSRRRNGLNLIAGLLSLQALAAWTIKLNALPSLTCCWLVGLQVWALAGLLLEESRLARNGWAAVHVRLTATAFALGLLGLIAAFHTPLFPDMNQNWMASIMTLGGLMAVMRRIMSTIDLGYLPAPVLAATLPVLMPVMPIPGIVAGLLLIAWGMHFRFTPLIVLGAAAIAGFAIHALLHLLHISWFTFGFLMVLVGAGLLAIVMRDQHAPS